MGRNLYLLVQEASGLTIPQNTKNISTRVTLKIGSWKVSLSTPKSFQNFQIDCLKYSFRYQVKCKQRTHPYGTKF